MTMSLDFLLYSLHVTVTQQSIFILTFACDVYNLKCVVLKTWYLLVAAVDAIYLDLQIFLLPVQMSMGYLPSLAEGVSTSTVSCWEVPGGT